MAHHHHILRVSIISVLTGGFSTLLFTSLQAQAGATNLSTGNRQSPEEYVPVRSVVYRSRSSVAGSYEPFAVCEGCRCCSSSNASSCVDTSCCYSIDCNLPGKPYGTCAFAPQSCGCGGAITNCTQPS